jgi:hypothetical protein
VVVTTASTVCIVSALLKVEIIMNASISLWSSWSSG